MLRKLQNINDKSKETKKRAQASVGSYDSSIQFPDQINEETSLLEGQRIQQIKKIIKDAGTLGDCEEKRQFIQSAQELLKKSQLSAKDVENLENNYFKLNEAVLKTGEQELNGKINQLYQNQPDLDVLNSKLENNRNFMDNFQKIQPKQPQPSFGNKLRGYFDCCSCLWGGHSRSAYGRIDTQNSPVFKKRNY